MSIKTVAFRSLRLGKHIDAEDWRLLFLPITADRRKDTGSDKDKLAVLRLDAVDRSQGPTALVRAAAADTPGDDVSEDDAAQRTAVSRRSGARRCLRSDRTAAMPVEVDSNDESETEDEGDCESVPEQLAERLLGHASARSQIMLSIVEADLVLTSALTHEQRKTRHTYTDTFELQHIPLATERINGRSSHGSNRSLP